MTPSPPLWPPLPAAAPSTSDDRMMDRAARLTTILLVAQISRDAGDDLCRIRNLSTGGMSIETMSVLALGERVSIAMKNGAVVACEVVWTLGREAGLRFDSPVDVADLLAIGARPPRSLRFATRCSVVLRRDGYLLRGMLADISQGGAKIQLSAPGRAGDTGTLAIPGLDSQRGVVRWAADGAAGLAFASPLTFAALSQWLSGDQRFSVAQPEHAPAPVNPIRQSS